MTAPIRPVVIKLGGDDLAGSALPGAVTAILASQREAPTIVVHGGGRIVDSLLEKLGVVPTYHEGQRVTDDATLDVVEMVLSGLVNKRLTLALEQAGGKAIGLSGVDGSLIKVEPWAAELGRVGRVVAIKDELLSSLLADGYIPVLSPVSAGADGRYNVNADHAAGALAEAVRAWRTVFVTNVPGVLHNGALTPRLTRPEVTAWIAQGIVTGGMIPKVQAALAALWGPGSQAVITNLAGLQAGTGTIFTP